MTWWGKNGPSVCTYTIATNLLRAKGCLPLKAPGIDPHSSEDQSQKSVTSLGLELLSSVEFSGKRLGPNVAYTGPASSSCKRETQRVKREGFQITGLRWVTTFLQEEMGIVLPFK